VKSPNESTEPPLRLAVPGLGGRIREFIVALWPGRQRRSVTRSVAGIVSVLGSLAMRVQERMLCVWMR
jgi:hypothetical protein